MQRIFSFNFSQFIQNFLWTFLEVQSLTICNNDVICHSYVLGYIILTGISQGYGEILINKNEDGIISVKSSK